MLADKVLVDRFAAGGDEAHIFIEHMRNLGWQADEPNARWAQYMADLVHYAILDDWAKEVVAPDGIETTVASEIRLLQLKEFVKAGS